MVSPLSRPLLLGHRGVRSVRRFGARGFRRQLPAENTLSAFEYALSHGCDGIEFDVRFSRDGRGVICHDPHFGDQDVSSTNYSQLMAGGNELACLEDVLNLFGQKAFLDIEVKVHGHEQQVVAALRSEPPSRGHIVSSFFPGVLLRLHLLDATLPLGYICDRSEYVNLWTELPVSVFVPQYDLVSQEMLDAVHRRGLKLFAWTVNLDADLLRLASWGVDGLISDDPALLSRTFPLRPLSR